MSERELRRVEVLSRVKAGELKLVGAAELMGLDTGKRSGCGGGIASWEPAGCGTATRGEMAKPLEVRQALLCCIRTGRTCICEPPRPRSNCKGKSH